MVCWAGWTGSSDARTAYSITVIGLSTARDVAVRSAFAAFDLASIERGATAERQAVTANKDRIISDVRAYRDRVANSRASNRMRPLDPSLMRPGLLRSEMAQLHAENRARDRTNTLTDWGLTALHTWIATVDASGVLNANTTTTTKTASGATNPGTTGPAATRQHTTGRGAGRGTPPGMGTAAVDRHRGNPKASEPAIGGDAPSPDHV
jgi:hypothetical protein